MTKNTKQSILLESGTIYDPYNNKKQTDSVLIENGVVKKVGKIKPSSKMKRVDCKGKIISPGFIDIHAHFREPGREDQETLKTGLINEREYNRIVDPKKMIYPA